MPPPGFEHLWTNLLCVTLSAKVIQKIHFVFQIVLQEPVLSLTFAAQHYAVRIFPRFHIELGFIASRILLGGIRSLLPLHVHPRSDRDCTTASVPAGTRGAAAGIFGHIPAGHLWMPSCGCLEV